MHYRHEEGRHFLLRNASAGASVDSKYDNSIVWPFLIQVTNGEGYLGVMLHGANAILFVSRFLECYGKPTLYYYKFDQFNGFGATLDHHCGVRDCIHVVR